MDEPRCCEECQHYVASDGFWPCECLLADREVSPDPDMRPCWCPLGGDLD